VNQQTIPDHSLDLSSMQHVIEDQIIVVNPNVPQGYALKKDQRALNFFSLFGNLLLNKHCSKLRAYHAQLEWGGGGGGET